MNVRENISVVPRLLNWKEDKILERVKELIALVGLDVKAYINKYPSELSGGSTEDRCCQSAGSRSGDYSNG